MIIAWIRRRLRRRAARDEAAVLVRVFGERALDVNDQQVRVLDGAEREVARLVGVAVEQQLGLRAPTDWTIDQEPAVDAPSLALEEVPLDEIAITNSTCPPRLEAPCDDPRVVRGIGVARPWPFEGEGLQIPSLAVTLRCRLIGMEIRGNVPVQRSLPPAARNDKVADAAGGDRRSGSREGARGARRAAILLKLPPGR